MKKFLHKNLSWYHIAGILFFTALSVLYWYKSGQYSDNVLKNSIYLMIIWGILVGYILADMVKNAVKRNKNDEEK